MKAKSELTGDRETVAEVAIDGPILDINGEEIDPIWAAEFRGFFWGEGTLGFTAGQPLKRVHPHHNFTRHSIAIVASIGLRSDDAAILSAFQRRLGGTLRLEPYRGADTRKTISRWVVGTAMNNRRIGRLLESPTGLPFNKGRQLAIWREAVELKLTGKARTKGTARYTDEQHARLMELGQELVRLREWSG